MTSRKRLTPIEKLAREICWAEFPDRNPKVVGCTKAAYWAKLSERKHAEYVKDARYFFWLCRRLGAPEITKILADTDGIVGTE